MKSQNPHHKVLIIGAICLSLLAGVFSYKLAKYNQVAQEEKSVLGFFDITGDKEDSDAKKIQDAIDKVANKDFNEEEINDPFIITSKDSATDRFIKQFYSDYVNQEAGVSDLSADDVANNAISQLSSGDMPRAKYGLKDVSIFGNTTSTNIRSYGNTFAEIYFRNMSKVANNEAKYSSNLLEIAKVYEDISKELLKIQVPVEISTPHTAIVNNYQILADSFRLINSQASDPVKALLGVRSAKTTMEENDAMFISISKYFKNNGIIFNKSEAGYIWNINQ